MGARFPVGQLLQLGVVIVERTENLDHAKVSENKGQPISFGVFNEFRIVKSQFFREPVVVYYGWASYNQVVPTGMIIILEKGGLYFDLRSFLGLLKFGRLLLLFFVINKVALLRRVNERFLVVIFFWVVGVERIVFLLSLGFRCFVGTFFPVPGG